MIDSGATALFIHERFVKQNRMVKHRLPQEIGLRNIDGSANQAGKLTHFVRLKLDVGPHSETTEFLVTNLGPENVILGLPWLKRFNPSVDWDAGTLDFSSSPENSPPPFQRLQGNRAERRKWVKANIIEHSSDELWCAAGVTLSTELAAEKNQAKYGKPLESMIPPEYLSYRKVFPEEESHRLPKHQPWDHSIDLKPVAPETLKSKVYPMPLNEQEKLDCFIT